MVLWRFSHYFSLFCYYSGYRPSVWLCVCWKEGRNCLLAVWNCVCAQASVCECWCVWNLMRCESRTNFSTKMPKLWRVLWCDARRVDFVKIWALHYSVRFLLASSSRTVQRPRFPLYPALAFSGLWKKWLKNFCAPAAENATHQSCWKCISFGSSKCSECAWIRK